MRDIPGRDYCTHDQWCLCPVCEREREEADRREAKDRPRKYVVNEAEAHKALPVGGGR